MSMTRSFPSGNSPREIQWLPLPSREWSPPSPGTPGTGPAPSQPYFLLPPPPNLTPDLSSPGTCVLPTIIHTLPSSWNALPSTLPQSPLLTSSPPHPKTGLHPSVPSCSRGVVEITWISPPMNCEVLEAGTVSWPSLCSQHLGPPPGSEWAFSGHWLN